MANGLYSVQGSPEIFSLMASSKKRATAIELWHNRLGHSNKNTIKKMHRENSVLGMNLEEKPFNSTTECEPCLEGKQTRLQLKKKTSVAKKTGEIIYSDVFGPLPVEILGGGKYFVTFTDGYSRYLEVYIIRKKSEVAGKFMQFQKRFERQNETTIKQLYSDNGGEYEAISDYRKGQGIEWEPTAPYTPQRNGISERANRTLLNMVLTMLAQSGLPAVFWAEAVVTAAGTRNLTGISRLAMKTPTEVLTG